MISDGLGCFGGVTEAGVDHQPMVIGPREPKDFTPFHWVNTVLGNLKTSLSGAYHAFKFAKYATHYLSTFTYRFNRRFHLETLPKRLLIAAASIGPRAESWLRMAEVARQSNPFIKGKNHIKKKQMHKETIRKQEIFPEQAWPYH